MPGRRADDVAYWLFGVEPRCRESIFTASIDLQRGYADGLLRYLPQASVTIDHFHAVELAKQAINDVRRSIQNERAPPTSRCMEPLDRPTYFIYIVRA